MVSSFTEKYDVVVVGAGHAGCEVVQVYLPDYLRVLLDSVGAPIDATPENLGPDASIQQNGLFAFKLLPNRLITH